ncbi:MAG TPA: hypothetical protein O0Y17_04135, partial [Methanocorpusculum sp.]|nr:hypothetical protein [Methanocorpusculum sp.]
MPHEYRPPSKHSAKRHGNKGGEKTFRRRLDKDRAPRKAKPKSLGLELTRKDSIHAKLQKQLYWCPKCNIPLTAKTC